MLRGKNLKHSINLNIQRCSTPTSCHISLCSLHSQTSGNQSDIRSLRTSFAETDSTDGFVSRLSHETQGRTELTFIPALCQTVPAADMNSSPVRAAPAARSQPVLRQGEAWQAGHTPRADRLLSLGTSCQALSQQEKPQMHVSQWWYKWNHWQIAGRGTREMAPVLSRPLRVPELEIE